MDDGVAEPQQNNDARQHDQGVGGPEQRDGERKMSKPNSSMVLAPTRSTAIPAGSWRAPEVIFLALNSTPRKV